MLVTTPRIKRLLDPALVAMIANAGSLAGTTAVNALLGYFYWWLAARQFPPAAVGLAGAAVSAMTLLSTIGLMGLGTMLIGELHRREGGELPLIGAAAGVATLISAVLGAAFALVGAHLSTELAPLASSPATVVLFAAGVGLAGAAQVLDNAVVGLLRGELQFGRNLLFTAGKLGALVLVGWLLPTEDGLMIYATWLAGNLLSVLALAAVFVAMAGRSRQSRPSLGTIKGLGRTAVAHHALNVALNFSPMLLPVLVTTLLSATMNAYFYVAWMIAGVLYLGPATLTIVLHAVGVRDPATLGSKMRLTLGLAFAGALAANLVLFFAAEHILALFGEAYPTYGAPTLKILALGVIPSIVKEHYVAVKRITERTTGAAVLIVGGACLELSFVAIGASLDGLRGLSLGWVAALTIEAAVMARPVYRAATFHGSAPTPSTSPFEALIPSPPVRAPGEEEQVLPLPLTRGGGEAEGARRSWGEGHLPAPTIGRRVDSEGFPQASNTR
jgi:O-antigen/teichoic acid export membrane protein